MKRATHPENVVRLHPSPLPAPAADPASDPPPPVPANDAGSRPRRSRSGQTVKDLPRDQRPRERLVQRGGSVLDDAELLAVLLRTGREGQSAIDMAGELLAEHGGLAGLLWTDARRLRRPGLGTAKIGAVLAAIELARRLSRASFDRADLMNHPRDVAHYVLMKYGRIDQEVMGALYVDIKQRLLAESEIFRGTLTRAAVEPRSVLREALLHGASGVVLFHTHPSGDPAPSAADYDFTKTMVRACRVLGVQLVDHLVIGGFGRWVSLKEHGAC